LVLGASEVCWNIIDHSILCLDHQKHSQRHQNHCPICNINDDKAISISAVTILAAILDLGASEVFWNIIDCSILFIDLKNMLKDIKIIVPSAILMMIKQFLYQQSPFWQSSWIWGLVLYSGTFLPIPSSSSTPKSYR
jgi:hypothetical protein